MLQTMGFMPDETHEGRPDFALFQELWLIVQGEERGGIFVEDLFYILEIIKG